MFSLSDLNNMQEFDNWELEMQHDAKNQVSLKQLQNIYFKNKNKKKELQQISHFNKTYLINQEIKQKQQQQPSQFDTKNLLNQNEVSFKTVEKIYTQMSCFLHILCIVMIFLLNQQYFMRIISGLVQIILIMIHYLHYYFKKSTENTVADLKCLKNRSKYILLQIVMIIIADLLALVITTYQVVYSYFYGILVIVDVLLARKLYNLYQVQKNMDMEFEQDQFSSFEQQFKNQIN